MHPETHPAARSEVPGLPATRTPSTAAAVIEADLAYPLPSPHPLWSRRSKCRPLTPQEQQHNRELLLAALRGPHT
ncbi:hypothetical protein GCM10010329_80570 [Streptomyces spiroverticillatus]|uniref:Uncharacterized protein n=1 Tax=Streptomyces finlayi TaxID=67296 RepID=A0A918X701_9ACTN|nr:hypothetical protein [Streptomyces finlayi]GHA45892.1 hypothetical protein GCM10010329_80570 [Streptomyces spiroverticillatus]GHD15945.1 hypothetical protein GCM10010334_76490 [Streptomyces finlayi]